MAGLAAASSLALPDRAPADALDRTVAADLELARERMRATHESVPPGSYPFYTGPDGAWVTAGPRAWVAGLFPGALWLLNEATGDPSFAAAAAERQDALRLTPREEIPRVIPGVRQQEHLDGRDPEIDHEGRAGVERDEDPAPEDG